MNNKTYLNEEEYQKTNKKVSRLGTIFFIIGILMIAGAIFNFIYSSKVLDDLKYQAISGPLLVFGFAFLGYGGMAKFTSNQRKITAYMMQQQMPIAKEAIENMAPTVGKASGTMFKAATQEAGEEMTKMAGSMAKEVTKGIVEGINEEKNK